MNSPIKVLSLNVSDSSGGAARAAYRIHKSVIEFGVISQMLVLYKDLDDDSVIKTSDFYSKNYLSEAFRFVQKKINNKKQHFRWNKYPNRDNVFMSDLRSESLHGALQKIDYDILHLHWVNLHFLDLNELTKVNKPIIWTLHDCWPFTGVCHYFYNCNRYRASCGRCPHLRSEIDNDLSAIIWKRKREIYNNLNLNVVSPSRWLAVEAKQSSLFRSTPITIIPNPINTELFSPGSRSEACTALHLDKNKSYFLYCAMNALADKNKGYEYILNAFNLLKKQTGFTEIELLIAGADEPVKGAFLNFPVHYLGVIKDETLMVNAYRAAILTLVPSLSENLSNVIIESHSCGTPVVAFNTGGNMDIIDHMKTGYLVDKMLPDEIVNGIKWCIDNNTEGNLSKNARNKATKNFSSEKVGSQYYQLYKSLVEQC